MGAVSNSISKKEYKPLYLLYGEEAYLRNYYKNALKNALVTEGDNLNYSYYEGTSTDPDEVAGMILTMPFMAEKRVVIVENSGWLAPTKGQDDSGEKSSGKTQRLLDAMKEISEDVVFIMVEEKADKRSKLFKTISDKGICEEFAIREEGALVSWLQKIAASYGKNMDAGTAHYLIGEAGSDMMLLENEIMKLISWALDKNNITIADVDTVCTHQVTGKIFDMISAIANHQQKQALDLYYDLITLRESPFAILSLLTRQYTQMLTVKDCMNRNMPDKMIESKMGLQSWVIKRLKDVSKKMRFSEIKACLEACAQADEDIKTGNLTDSMSVELLIVTCSEKVR